jgi:hypothetical protein
MLVVPAHGPLRHGHVLRGDLHLHSAIIGFGGVAANFGFALMLAGLLNIFVGIFVAFAVFGKRTRRMGLALDSTPSPSSWAAL